MRENMGIYRGQTKDGEWVEGNLVHADDIIPPKTGTLNALIDYLKARENND